jgi:hypothetical protein
MEIVGYLDLVKAWLIRVPGRRRGGFCWITVASLRGISTQTSVGHWGQDGVTHKRLEHYYALPCLERLSVFWDINTRSGLQYSMKMTKGKN